MINEISIKGYKSIKELDLKLTPVNILLGANGVGKSNFISIFSLIRNIYNKNLQNYVQARGGANSLLHFGSKISSEIKVGVSFVNGINRNQFYVTLANGQDSLFIKEVKTAYWNSGWYPKIFEQNVLESDFQNINKGQAFFVNDLLKEFDVYHFHDTSDTSPMKKQADVNDNRRLRKDGSNLASFLYYLQQKEEKSFKRIERMIQSIAPYFECFNLEPNRLNVEKIKLEWKEKGASDSYFNAYYLSDGTLRFICLATLLMQPNPPSTIIIDEPELGLHPVAINKLASMIRKASSRTQVIVSTQSTNLIDNFDPDDIIVTDRGLGESGTTFRRLTKEELRGWLEEYTLGDLWGKNQFGAQPY